MFLGILVGFLFNGKTKFIKIADKLCTLAIFLLLFLLGLNVGTNDEILKNFHNLGLQAIILTLGAVFGSLIVALITYKLFFNKK
jgi:uncharacterized membrane protein YbjE (DUF340 family)